MRVTAKKVRVAIISEQELRMLADNINELAVCEELQPGDESYLRVNAPPSHKEWRELVRISRKILGLPEKKLI